jgi:hypothetical protein
MRLWVGRRGASLVAVGATLAVSTTGLAFASSPKQAGPDGQAAFAASARQVQAAEHFKAGNYIVLLKQAPAATYRGGVAGQRATAPGGSFAAGSPAVASYQGYLAGQQSSLAHQYGVTVRQRYTVAVNGFSAHLSSTQARALAADSRVMGVTKDRLEHADRVPTVGPHATSEFLGLTHHGHPAKGWNPRTAGKGIVVGVIDSGIWPENPAFAGKKLQHKRKVSASNPDPIFVGSSHKTAFHKADGKTFHGKCVAGQRFKANTCNSKLISARYFDTGFLQFQPRNTWSPAEFASARDGVGHGSHTSSTAAGDYGVKAKVFGKGYGRITGIAPAAKIATYKVLWATADDPSDASGFNSDIVAGIDRAVADGVDVINFSVGPSGGDSDIIDPIAVAFLNAAASGVFVAAAGGNDGPDAATTSNVSPWVTTAAASTWQTASGTVVLGNGQKVLGASLTSDGTKAPLVYAADVSKQPTGSDGATAAQCGLGTLDRSKVEGKIVLCDRGENVLVNKVADAQRAHAAGIIIGDVTQPDIVSLSVPLPMVSVHIDGRTKILDYINQPGGANATLVDGNKTSQKAEPVPAVAGFSSRGPSQINADVLKPDVAAPGVGVLAAVAPPSNSGQNFDFYDGTSMATPHIAGLAAWQLGKRPKLGPDELRSMFMTTAHDTVDADGHKAHDAFAQGAGQVSARRLGDPGLVFPAGIVDWFAWLEGQGISTGTGIPGIPGYELNEPSIMDSSLVSSTTLTRTVKNISGHRETYHASYKGDAGVAVSFKKNGSFSPTASYTIGAGKRLTIKIKLETVSGLDEYAMGNMTLASNQHNVRIPLVARPEALSVDDSVSGTGTSDEVAINGVAGSDGTVTATVQGLVGSTPEAGNVPQDPDGLLGNADVSAFHVPAGQAISRIDLDAGTGADDLDLYLFADDGTPFDPDNDTLVALSATGSASEQLIGKIPAGDYWIVVDGFAVESGGGNYDLTTWNVPTTDSGNLTLQPTSQSVTAGNPFSITASWSGLDADKVYFGQVTSTLASQDATTLVTVRPGS